MEKRSSSTNGSIGVGQGTGHGLADLPPDQLAARVEEMMQLLDQLDGLLTGSVQLSAPARKTAVRLRGDAEVAALEGVLQFAAVHEPLFAALADEDEGVERTKFETALVSGRLSNAQTLSGLAARLGQIQLKAADTALYTTSLAKPIALKAWEVAKVYVDRYPAQAELLNPAVNFYRGKALIAARTRARKKAQQAGASAAPSIAPSTDTPQK